MEQTKLLQLKQAAEQLDPQTVADATAVGGGILVFLVVSALVSALVGWLIGRTKGRGTAGFWLSFFFGFFGWIAVGMMEKKQNQ